MIAGWFAILSGFGRAPSAAPRPTVASVAPLPPPDETPEFQGIMDRQQMTARDVAAYAELLRRVRETPFPELAKASRRDILFSQLIENPKRYRGLPIHVEGVVRRVLRQDVPDSKIFRDGVYYEAHLFSEDSMGHPLVIAFEQAPPDLEIGDTWRRVTFDGYFLKLWAYQAADTFRVAPLLIGRFPPATSGAPLPANSGRPIPWPVVVLGVISAYIALRFLMLFQRLRKSSLALRSRRAPIKEEIEPEALEAWLNAEPENDPEADR